MFVIYIVHKHTMQENVHPQWIMIALYNFFTSPIWTCLPFSENVNFIFICSAINIQRYSEGAQLVRYYATATNVEVDDRKEKIAGVMFMFID